MTRTYRWLGLVIGGVLLLRRLADTVEGKVIEQPVLQQPDSEDSLQPDLVERHLTVERGRSCFDSGQRLLECARGEVFRIVDRAIDSNVTFRVGPFLTVAKNPAWARSVVGERRHEGTPTGDWRGLVPKLRAFLLSRVFQFRLVDDDGRWLLATTTDEARGKKHKHKQGGMIPMALMALMAMIAQVVLGKVAVLAAVALIMAKIALVFSTLNGLKKGTGASGGHGPEHVVYEHQGGHGGGGGGGGWQRSIDPRKPYPSYQYYDDDNDVGGDEQEDHQYRKRRPDYYYQDPLKGA